MATPKHLAVGIDLGTTFSSLAYLDSEGRPQTVPNAEGDLTTPSAVFFDRTRPVVGCEAIEAGTIEPERLALFAKRDVGEQAYEKQIRGESLPPEVVQALVLKKLIDDAQPRLGKITKAVVTVPAFFNEPCRKATQDAGRLIGLEILDIINEPTAAAIAYGVQTGFLASDGTSEHRRRVLVYDLGGGTFDVTVMEIDGMRYRALATAGDVYLGGIDWDTRIVDYACEQFMLEHDCDPRVDPALAQELTRKATLAKHALCQRDEFPIVFTHEGHRFKLPLSREKFEFLTSDFVDRTILTMQMAVRDARLSMRELSRIILVGGSTRMPMIQTAVEAATGQQVDRTLSPDEAIGQGAALYAGLLLRSGGSKIVGMSVSNVNSHDLGVLAIENATGRPRRQIMIPRNNALPAKRTVRFRTHQPDQSSVKIQVVEGGDDSGNDATQIGSCVIDELPDTLPQGTSVDVQFRYSGDGRLRVTATMPDIDRQVRLTLNRDAGLTPDTFDYWQQRIADGMPDSSVDSFPRSQASEPSRGLDSPDDSSDDQVTGFVVRTDAKHVGKKSKTARSQEAVVATQDAGKSSPEPASPTPPMPDFSSLKSMTKKKK
ncbi:Chaperone protein DnaK [Rosistilla oblonga]|uniref:Hsp70 family protein n=1 Tax=Rosistilla oblonga TaxID=2527990 RepID=UPI00118A6202|nr:Hsp70 family protein [Rosistilla oblonga]QDV14879.1 Chaperone protein DnaK [Rosistilla oblonga]